MTRRRLESPPEARKLLGLPDRALHEFCRKWGVASMELFGSTARGEARADSDLDVLVTFEGDHEPGLIELTRMENELAELVGRSVDLNNRRAVEASENTFRKVSILRDATLVYPSFVS